MEVQFLAFSGCPLATPARKNLETALAACDMSDYEEIDLLGPEISEDTRGWGSPTILINGSDVSGAPRGNSISCRVYANPEGVPEVQAIITCLSEI